MTPDRRLDQLEPLMADSLQKIDRLIEGQGRIIDLVSQLDRKAHIANEKADLVNQKADITAKAVANITIGLQKVGADINQLKDGQARLEANQNEILTLLRERLK